VTRGHQATAQHMSDVVRAVPDELVTREAMARILTVSVPTFDRMRHDAKREGNPCPEITWGRRMLRYRPRDVWRWAESLEGRRVA
jgi:hypothetical protein